MVEHRRGREACDERGGVGKATTDTVVAISITVLVSNFLLTNLFMSFAG